MPQQPGEIVAEKYRLVRRLARGGMGAVWQARHLGLDSDVAVKFRRADAEGGKVPDERFRREARLAAQLKSPHVVHVYDFGLHENEGYIAMELLEGQDFAELIEESPLLPEAQACSLLAQAARGVQLAHEQGLIHRDIKPSNLFVTLISGQPLVKVLDFGIAKQKVDEGAELTAGGIVLGSPAYMSPEQTRGGRVDERADIWGLSSVLYQMLTAQPPFDGENSHDIVVKICTTDVVPPGQLRAELGKRWDEFFRLAMHRDPARRIASVQEWLDRLARVTGDESLQSSSPEPVVQLHSGLAGVGRDDETQALEEPEKVALPGPLLWWSAAGLVVAFLVLVGGEISKQRSPTTTRSRAASDALDQATPAALPRASSLTTSASLTTPLAQEIAAEAAVSNKSEADAAGALRAARPPADLPRAEASPGSRPSLPLGALPPRAVPPRAEVASGDPPRSNLSPDEVEPTQSPATDPVFGLPLATP